jgi:hypothetical protein
MPLAGCSTGWISGTDSTVTARLVGHSDTVEPAEIPYPWFIPGPGPRSVG